MNFTRDQLEAVDIGKRHLDTCVVAGPGSGKTTVLVESLQDGWWRRGGPVAHPGHHLHREGRGQHAQEAGAA